MNRGHARRPRVRERAGGRGEGALAGEMPGGPKRRQRRSFRLRARLVSTRGARPAVLACGPGWRRSWIRAPGARQRRRCRPLLPERRRMLLLSPDRTAPGSPEPPDASPSCCLPGGKGRGTGCRGGAGLGSSAGKGFSRGNSSFCPAQPALPPRGTRRCQRRPHLTLTVGCELLMAMQLLVPASLLQTAAAAPRSWGG